MSGVPLDSANHFCPVDNAKHRNPRRPHRRNIFWPTVCILLFLLFSVNEAKSQGTLSTVHIYNFDFSLNGAGEPVIDPVIQPGDTVRWVWDQGFHSTTAAAGQLELWDSGVQSGGSFSHLFTQQGVFYYYSRTFGEDVGDGTAIGMSGIITVIPEPATAVLLGFGAVVAMVVFKLVRRDMPEPSGTPER